MTKKILYMFSITITLVSLVFLSFHSVVLADTFKKSYPPDSYANAIVLRGNSTYASRTIAIFEFEKQDNASKISASYGITKGSDLTDSIHSAYGNTIYYEASLIGKNGDIKKNITAKANSRKQVPLDKWGAVETESGDIFSIYTYETDKSYWYDASGNIGNLPPDYLADWNKQKNPNTSNASGDKSRSTLYYMVTNNGFERIKLEDLSNVTITEGDSLSRQIKSYFKINYNQDIPITTDLGFRNNESGTYTNVNVSTTDSRFNQIFQNVFKNGITVHVNPRPVIFDISVPSNLKFNDHTLGLGNNQVALQSNPMVTIEDTRKNSPGWNLSLSSNNNNALAQNLIFKNNNEVQHISNESTVIWNGSGSLIIPLAEHLFVQVPNDRSFLAQDYETTLTWNLASTP